MGAANPLAAARKIVEIEEKAKEEQEKEQEAEPLSAYEACVLKESAKIHELIAEAQKEGQKDLEDE